jgi:hypothetical protein
VGARGCQTFTILIDMEIVGSFIDKTIFFLILKVRDTYLLLVVLQYFADPLLRILRVYPNSLERLIANSTVSGEYSVSTPAYAKDLSID